MGSLHRVETPILGGTTISTPLESALNNAQNEEECEEYDEEEDVDFNPFLKETPSREASSSLSSEVEAVDSEIDNSSSVVQNLDGGEDDKKGEEQIIAVQISVPCEEPSHEDSNRMNSESISQKESGLVREEGSTEYRTVEINENGGQSCDMIPIQKQGLMSNEEDAICRRTRAQYSLENFTLDDLEAFLQETDDEDEIPNVDDEEEYQKFLAAVLQSGNDEVQLVQNENNDDDDDNDIDFEIELEEALETDDEESIPQKVIASDNNSTKRRPVTRQKKRQNNSIQHKKNSPEQANRLLRPLVPILPIRPIPPPSRRYSTTEAVASSEDSLINGFSQAQIGELRCLIGDHLQLLIQVYSLCVLDPSRQQIGTQVQGLISEMVQQHEEYVARRSHLFLTDSASSVLGVVSVAGSYLVDVSSAVQEYRRCQVESGFDASSQRVPLFPLPNQDAGGVIVNSSNSALSKSPSDQQQSKKTLAAMLVESAKKQSVALVHENIAKLAKRFSPLFKVSLFPHKPPPVAVANRVLFTDAEDELLALGIMEYNSDWKLIKQRFLPCKSEHQIYVRQKNRRSSKAQENPIKAVRRMKSSPLTPQEIARIQEGLNYFKQDWMSVWKFIVPYRDPSSLPRQWRIALGVQKSYKQDALKKEKRRLYELHRKSREQPSSEKEDHGASKVNDRHVGDELVDNPGEAYLHEGFLADWRPGIPNLFNSTSVHSFDKAKDVPCEHIETVQTCTSERSKNPEFSGAQIPTCLQRPAPSLIPQDYQRAVTPPVAPRALPMMRPYRARKLYNARVVRLAPELPPVNLPPSVRVISQSVFTRNHSESSSKPFTNKGGLSDVCERENLGTQPPCLSADRDKNDPPSERMVDLQEDVPAESSSGMGERNNDSDLQMHPLLFRTPEHGQITSYLSNRDPGGSSSFSFFSHDRPQLLSLFNSPRQVNHSADQFQKMSTLNEHEAASGDNCFHPLLQRTDYETSCLVNGGGDSNQDIGKKYKSCQFQDTSTQSAGHNDVSSKQAKNVNLDIHLSSSSSKVKESGRVSAANTSEFPNISVIKSSHRSEMRGATAPNNDISSCIDEMAEPSNLGIVMEQEELSDSDEEMMEEENVEFECEEMADSEGEEEGSECEEIEMQDKDNNRSPAGDTTATDVDSGKEQWSDTHIHSQNNISSLPSLGSSVPQELGKDSPKSPWLSLDPSNRRLSTKVKDIEKTVTKEPAKKTTITQYVPSRSHKKRTSTKRRDAESNEDAGVALLKPGPLAHPSLKKPRKCVEQAEINPNVEIT